MGVIALCARYALTWADLLGTYAMAKSVTM
jgi:hypothetical protein